MTGMCICLATDGTDSVLEKYHVNISWKFYGSMTQINKNENLLLGV